MTGTLAEANSLRTWAIFGSTLATLGTLITVITFPMVYEHVQMIQTLMDSELDFCRHRAAIVFSEIRVTKMMLSVNRQKRHVFNIRRNIVSSVTSRQSRNVVHPPSEVPYDVLQESKAYQPLPTQNNEASYGGSATNSPPVAAYQEPITTPAPVYQTTIPPAFDYSNNQPLSTGCCGCGQSLPGPVGPPGPPGSDGYDGLPGQPGNEGSPAQELPYQAEPEFCFDCSPGPVGPAGQPGQPGRPGQSGYPGRPGVISYPGRQGHPGHPGPRGEPGAAGRPGHQGNPGRLYELPVRTGPPGPPGLSGQPGQPGYKGSDGQPGTTSQGPPGDVGPVGQPGLPGESGPQGEIGTTGEPGSCGHCHIPRTAPGY